MALKVLECIHRRLPTKESEIQAKIRKADISYFMNADVCQILRRIYDSDGQLMKHADWTLSSADAGLAIQKLLDATWQVLNIGHWKDVALCWRYLYSFVSVFKVVHVSQQANVDFKKIVETCDMGLLMGAPVLDNVLAKVASLASKEIPIEDPPPNRPSKRAKTETAVNLNPDRLLPTEHIPSLETFVKNYRNPLKPVIIKGITDHWPALSSQKWSIEYLLEVAGFRTVPVEIGKKYTDETWSQKLMSLRDFVKTYIQNESPSNIGYLAQHELFDQIPELKEDIEIPEYCYLGEDEDVNINCWFGPGGTISPLHYDPKHNCLAQIFGEKFVRLYPEEVTPMVYPHSDHLLHNTSRVDVENVDPQAFPLFPSAPFWEGVLGPGDILYIPPKCWHYVRSLSDSFSISYWWS